MYPYRIHNVDDNHIITTAAAPFNLAGNNNQQQKVCKCIISVVCFVYFLYITCPAPPRFQLDSLDLNHLNTTTTTQISGKWTAQLIAKVTSGSFFYKTGIHSMNAFVCYDTHIIANCKPPPYHFSDYVDNDLTVTMVPSPDNADSDVVSRFNRDKDHGIMNFSVMLNFTFHYYQVLEKVVRINCNNVTLSLNRNRTDYWEYMGDRVQCHSHW